MQTVFCLQSNLSYYTFLEESQLKSLGPKGDKCKLVSTVSSSGSTLCEDVRSELEDVCSLGTAAGVAAGGAEREELLPVPSDRPAHDGARPDRGVSHH